MADKNYIRVSNPDRNLEVLEEQILSVDNKRYVALDNGKKVEVLVQKIDAKTGKLASKSKSLEPEIVEKTLVRPIAEDVQALDTTNPSSTMSEEERLATIAEKFKKKEERQQLREENLKVAQMTEDEEKDDDKEKAEQRKLEKEIVERNQEAARNVTEQRDLKVTLEAQGKSRSEVKEALKDLKKSQKQRGRPQAEAIENPVKNPVTGEFEPSED